MNRLFHSSTVGAIGELLVQVRLLQFGVQAAPPLKDSGNDLIAVREDQFRAIQVRTSTKGRFACGDLLQKHYHILAMVNLIEDQGILLLDRSNVYLRERSEVTKSSYRVSELRGDVLSAGRVAALFVGMTLPPR